MPDQEAENAIDNIILDPQEILRMKITALMSKNSEVFLDLVLEDEFDISAAGWEVMINYLKQSSDFRKQDIASEVGFFSLSGLFANCDVDYQLVH